MGDVISDNGVAVSLCLSGNITQSEFHLSTKLGDSAFLSSARSLSLQDTLVANWSVLSLAVLIISSILGDMRVTTSVLALATFVAVKVHADDSILQQANDAYSSAIHVASSNLDKAKSIISEQISGTPKPIHEEMLSSADSAYSGAIAAASSRLDAAAASLSSVSNAAFPTQGHLESISSVASANYQAALAAASSQYSSAKVAVGATPTPAAQRYLDDARRSYYEAIGYAYAQYDEYTGQASSAIYGPPAGSVESATSVAAENWASLVAAASERI